MGFIKCSSFVCLLVFSLNVVAAENTIAENKNSDKNVSEPAGVTVVDAGGMVASNDEVFSTWSSEAELGFIKTTGNTETESLNFKFGLNNKRKDWEHSLKAEAANSSDSTGSTAERYFLSLRTQYSLSERSYLFGRLQYEDDRFSGYNYQASEVFGYGRRLVNKDTLKVNAEAGSGIRQNNFENGDSKSESIFLIGTDIDWKISKSASLTEALTSEVGEDRTISKSVTGLKTKINSSLSSKITYTVKHASEVPVGTKKTDTELAVTLVYAFK